MSALLQQQQQRWQRRAETALEQALTSRHDEEPILFAAMRYAVLGGGKRLRPMLVYATGEALGCDLPMLDPIAAAVEIIHAYSLIHDDLPAMDDDDLRRGKPTVHIEFDEATAILAGDALQALAFEVLAGVSASAEIRVQLIKDLAVASGSAGMAGGQSLDLAAEGKRLGERLGEHDLANIHRKKTGALIHASVMMAATVAQANSEQQNGLSRYAQAIGLAFQIQDDILDVIGDTATLGKPQGADHALEKSTYPALLGIEGAKQRATETLRQALAALAPLGETAKPLSDLARFVVERDR